MRQQVGVRRAGVLARQPLRCAPVGVRAIWPRLRRRHIGVAHLPREAERHEHRIDRVEVRAVPIRIDSDPLFVWFLALVVVNQDKVRAAVMSGDPVGRKFRPCRPNGDRHSLRRHRRVGQFALLVQLAPSAGGATRVGELIRQDQRVVVAVTIESTDRVRVVGEALVAGNVPLHRPARPAVP